MRIGIVSQSYYPRYGGVTEHVHHTAVELRRRGHEVTIITSRFREGNEARHEIGVERIGTNIMVPFNRAFIDFTVGLSLRQQLRRLFHTYNFEVLHTHSPNAPSLPVLAVQEAWCAQVGTFQLAIQCHMGSSFHLHDLRGHVSDAIIACGSAVLFLPIVVRFRARSAKTNNKNGEVPCCRRHLPA